MIQPWFNKTRFKTFAVDLKILNEFVSESLEKSNDKKKETHKSKTETTLEKMQRFSSGQLFWLLLIKTI